MQSEHILLKSFENINSIMTFTKKKKDLAHTILRNNFTLLEEQSFRFHKAIKEILEQIVFYREQIGVKRDIYIPIG